MFVIFFSHRFSTLISRKLLRSKVTNNHRWLSTRWVGLNDGVIWCNVYCVGDDCHFSVARQLRDSNSLLACHTGGNYGNSRGIIIQDRLQVLIGKTGREALKRRVSVCDVAAIPVKVAQRVRQMLEKHSIDSVREASQGCATFYAWVSMGLIHNYITK